MKAISILMILITTSTFAATEFATMSCGKLTNYAGPTHWSIAEGKMWRELVAFQGKVSGRALTESEEAEKLELNKQFNIALRMQDMSRPYDDCLKQMEHYGY